ncbi:MAG: rod-binding protein [Alphaproteobacteria bacterium]
MMTDLTAPAARLAARQPSGPQESLAAMAQAARKGGGLDKEAVRAAAEDYETVFLASVFETLQQGIATDGPFGGGPGEAMFRSLLTQEYAKAMTAQGGIGLADKIVSELQRYQEV